MFQIVYRWFLLQKCNPTSVTSVPGKMNKLTVYLKIGNCLTGPSPVDTILGFTSHSYTLGI